MCSSFVITSSAGRASTTSMNCVGSLSQATDGWRTRAGAALAMSSSRRLPKAVRRTARSTAASCVARFLRLASVASVTGLGLPRPRTPAFCSKGSSRTMRPSVRVLTTQTKRSCTEPSRARAGPAGLAPSARMEASASRQLSCTSPTKNGAAASLGLAGSPSKAACARRAWRAAQAKPARSKSAESRCTCSRSGAGAATGTRSQAASSRCCRSCSDCAPLPTRRASRNRPGSRGASPRRWSTASCHGLKRPNGSCLPPSEAANLRALVQLSGAGSASSAIK